MSAIANEHTAASPVKSELSKGKLLGYGVGDLGFSLVWTTIGTFLTYFYTDVALISAAVIGNIMLFSRLLDGVSDIVMGVIVDRTHTKNGKARPWIFRMAVPLAMSFILLFTIPDVGLLGQTIYVAITYNVMLTVYTATGVPYNAMLSLITRNPYTRSLANIFRIVFALVASLIVSFFTLPLVDALGGGQAAWIMVAVGYSIIAAVLLFVLYRSTREVVDESLTKKDNTPLKTSFKALFKNKYWVIMLGVCVFSNLKGGIGSGGIYYAQYILGDAGYVGLLSLAMLIPLMVGVIFSAPIIKRFGKRNAGLVGTGLSIIISAIRLIDPTSLPLAIIVTAVGSLVGAPMGAALYAMINDTVEYGDWKTGLRMEGMVNSAASFGIKVGTGLGTAMMGWFMGLSGYVGGAAVQTPAATQMIILLNVHIPLLISIVTFVLLCFYKLDKEYPAIIEDLKLRESKNKP